MPESTDLLSVLSLFAVDFDDRPPIAPFGRGHVNGTYLAGTNPPTVLQRINRAVFPSPERVAENVARVTAYLKGKIALDGGDPERETLTVVPARDTGLPYVALNGEVYRLTRLIPNAVSRESADPESLYRAAKTFGRFLHRLDGFSADGLYEVIPRFHDTPARFAQLKAAIASDPVGRAASVAREIDFALSREHDCGLIVNGLLSGDLPLRVTHNDTKLNNFLFDRNTGDCIALIDLDTVMPGSLLYDYGDALRSGAASAAEDEADLSKVFFRVENIAAFTRGFLEEFGSDLSSRERELIPFSIRLLALECGIRFLADYIAGDVYFKTDRPEHNLDRARNQFALVKNIEPQLSSLARLVE